MTEQAVILSPSLRAVILSPSLRAVILSEAKDPLRFDRSLPLRTGSAKDPLRFRRPSPRGRPRTPPLLPRVFTRAARVAYPARHRGTDAAEKAPLPSRDH